MNYACPNCGYQISVGGECAGQVIQCSTCLHEMRIPESQPIPEALPIPPSFSGTSMPRKTNLAIASMILGILSFICIGPLGAIPAVILGHISRSRAKSDPRYLDSKAMALAGLILGYSNIVLLILSLVVLPFILAAAIEVPSTAVMNSIPKPLEQMNAEPIPAVESNQENAMQETAIGSPDENAASTTSISGEESRLREECANNLKQLGMFFKAFANESRGERFPALSPVSGQLMFVNESTRLPQIYPEYLQNPNWLNCPENPVQIAQNVNDPDKMFDDASYFYLGYAITTDEEMVNFAEAYKKRLRDGLLLDSDLEEEFGKGVAGGRIFYMLREGI